MAINGKIPTEFYNQRKWLEIHQESADSIVATNDGKIICAVYISPDERVRQDQQNFIQMLKEWYAKRGE